MPILAIFYNWLMGFRYFWLGRSWFTMEKQEVHPSTFVCLFVCSSRSDLEHSGAKKYTLSFPTLHFTSILCPGCYLTNKSVVPAVC